jgi:CheY-like chemotaxis protein
MNKNGAIIIIEDDIDDQEIFSDVFKELNYKNEIVFFNDGQEALTYLFAKTTEPFIVFSDINMPKLNGLELRKQIHENKDIRIKTIPYLFFTTSAAQESVVDAYSKSIQGFFVKPSNFQDLKSTMKIIIEYWQKCQGYRMNNNW